MKGISEIIATIIMLLVTLAISGVAYFFFIQTFTYQTQGLEIVDAFCMRDSTGKTNAIMSVRNIGSLPVDKGSVGIIQTAPSQTTDVTWSADVIEPGKAAYIYDECEGTGSRTCIYRITPPAGRSILAALYCF